MYFVTVPTATILGGPDLHVDKGSTINLTCTIRFSPEPPAYIFWYHHDEVSLKPCHIRSLISGIYHSLVPGYYLCTITIKYLFNYYYNN